MSAVMIEMETPEKAARRLSRAPISDGFKPAALYPYTYTDANGEGKKFWRIRLKHPNFTSLSEEKQREYRGSAKWIRPMHFNGDCYIIGEPEFPGGKPLYHLHVLAANPDALVFVTEGENKVEALAHLGIVATTSGSAKSAAGTEWGTLASRRVTIWPDNDQPGRDYAEAVRRILLGLGATVTVIDVALLGLGEGEDVVQWLAAHPSTTAADIEALPMLAVGTNAESAPASDPAEEHESQASQLVKFVIENTELFHDGNKDVYAQEKATRETRRIDGRAFRDWLLAKFYEVTEKSARDQAVREAIATLTGIGRFKGKRRDVHVRVAADNGGYYIDLAEPNNSRAVHVAAGRWGIVEEPPVLFIRPEGLQPLPAPVRGGSIEPLWMIANIPVNARLLVVAWLCECLRPDTPFPVLEQFGEQGTAKSTTQGVLRDLIDPNACNLRASPKSSEDIFVSAGVNWLVSYENLSHMPGPMQDALCTLATGGGFAKRRLYTDADEAIINVHRPVALNGISIVVTQQDLIDRTVTIELPPIKSYEDSAALRKAFEADRGRILGGLLDLMVKALSKLPTMTLRPDERPRLIEFARLGMALAVAAGRPAADFMKQFNASRTEAIYRTIDASPVATALIEWFDKSGKPDIDMPVGDLMRKVEVFKVPNSESWPRSPKGFADALRRAAPGLRHVGIECRSLGKIGGAIKWKVSPKRNLPEPCPASPDVLPETPEPESEQDIRTFRTLQQEVSSTGSDERIEL